MNNTDLNSLPKKDGFRLRGTGTTRLETFLDAAFAFATTLLVISLGSIPDSYEELILALKGIPAFAASFVSIIFLWLLHRKWSQRYGLEDKVSTLISLTLIFIILVYVYPLKMVFSALFAWLSGGWFPSTFNLQNASELANLFIIYGLGFAAVMLMYTLLYKRALSNSKVLQLNDLEILKTKNDLFLNFVLFLTAILSALFAFIFPVYIAVYAGFVYWSLPVSMTLTQAYFSKRIKKLSES